MKLKLSNFKSQMKRAFSLIEMLVVIAIIGILAAMMLPHLGGFGKSNAMISATKQVLDDVALARQKALLNRTTVYMVFLPPAFWSGPNSTAFADMSPTAMNQTTNLFTGQYTMYALLSLRTVGDQPGRPYAKYLTPWRRLPEGVTIAKEKFTTRVFVTLQPSQDVLPIEPFANNPLDNSPIRFPFPSIESTGKTAPKDYFQLPYVAFLPNGSLAPTGVQTNKDEYIPLTRASVLYPQDANGNPQIGQADWVETPPGTSTNDYHLIHINWLTGRAKLERKEIQ
jgi:prepilin-type N-terminal cleavage/methylation domain-containing protein